MHKTRASHDREKSRSVCLGQNDAEFHVRQVWSTYQQTQVVESDNPKRFLAFHESDKFDIHYVGVLIEERVELHHKHEVKGNSVSPNLDIFMACFTSFPRVG